MGGTGKGRGREGKGVREKGRGGKEEGKGKERGEGKILEIAPRLLES
jgi:hypothetical protein